MTNLIGFRSTLRRIARRVLFFSVIALPIASLSVEAARAQSDWVNPDVIALREDVRRLEAEISALRAGAPSPSASGLGGDFFLRMEQIETRLRGLTGRIEQLEFAQRRGDQSGGARFDALDQRLAVIEGRLGLSPAASLAPSGAGETLASAPPPQTFDQSYTASGAELLDRQSGSALGQDYAGGVEVDENGRPVSAGAGSFATEPGSLGSIPSSGPSLEQSFGSGSELPQASASFATSGGDPETAFLAAIERVKSGAFDDAERSLRDFIDNYPNDARIGEAKYWLGETHYVRGEFAEAAKIFLDAFRQHPQSDRAPDSLLKVGMTLAQLNQPEQACLTYAEVLSRFPGASPTVLRRARTEAERARCQ